MNRIKVNVFLDSKEQSKEWIESFIDNTLDWDEMVTTTDRGYDFEYVSFVAHNYRSGAVGVRGHAAIVPESSWFTPFGQEMNTNVIQKTLVERNFWFKENGFDKDTYIYQINKRDSMRGIFKSNGNMEGLSMMVNVARQQHKSIAYEPTYKIVEEEGYGKRLVPTGEALILKS